jgi:hypothetical protein
LGAAAAAGAVGSTTLVPTGVARAAPQRRSGSARVLQPGVGRTRGRYIRALPDQVSWGRLPNRDSEPVAVVHSGAVVTMDTISHEGVLEDQSKDPRAFFETYGVHPRDVLKIEVLELPLRVPYGVISNRHGEGGCRGSTPSGSRAAPS